MKGARGPRLAPRYEVCAPLAPLGEWGAGHGEVGDAILRILPNSGLVAAGSPYEIREEVLSAIRSINFYLSRAKGLQRCLVTARDAIRVRSSGCLDVVRELCRRNARVAGRRDSVIALALRAVEKTVGLGSYCE